MFSPIHVGRPVQQVPARLDPVQGRDSRRADVLEVVRRHHVFGVTDGRPTEVGVAAQNVLGVSRPLYVDQAEGRGRGPRAGRARRAQAGVPARGVARRGERLSPAVLTRGVRYTDDDAHEDEDRRDARDGDRPRGTWSDDSGRGLAHLDAGPQRVHRWRAVHRHWTSGTKPRVAGRPQRRSRHARAIEGGETPLQYHYSRAAERASATRRTVPGPRSTVSRGPTGTSARGRLVRTGRRVRMRCTKSTTIGTPVTSRNARSQGVDASVPAPTACTTPSRYTSTVARCALRHSRAADAPARVEREAERGGQVGGDDRPGR